MDDLLISDDLLINEDNISNDLTEEEYELFDDSEESLFEVQENMEDTALEEVQNDIQNIEDSAFNDEVVDESINYSAADSDDVTTDTFYLLEAVNHNIVILNDNINKLGSVSIAITAMIFGGIMIYCWLGGLR